MDGIRLYYWDRSLGLMALQARVRVDGIEDLNKKLKKLSKQC